MMKPVVLIFSFRAIYNNSKGKFRSLNSLNDDYNIIILSHDNNNLESAKKSYSGLSNIHYVNRKYIRQAIANNPDFTYIIIGSVDEDLYLAANNKFLCFNALWAKSSDVKINFYGIPVNKIKSLPIILDLLTNTTGWYRKIQVDSSTTIYSLMNARTRTSEYNQAEKDLINIFHKILKDGDRHLFKVLLYYLLGTINRDANFKDIKDWSIFPSSGKQFNAEMLEFKEIVRYMMNGKKTENIFIRHTTIKKSHTLPKEVRLYCNRHFDSISLNPIYKGKLKNRAVCIFDDYLTNGTSFEAARNLLLSEGVSKIICVSLGTFNNAYLQQDYKITGSVFSQNYKYNLKNSKYLNTDEYNESAMNDISKIADLFV